MPPPIRILHHMARSGGTVISKCIGSMKDVYLLSEIHPLGMRFINPLGQAAQWYGLINQQDINRLAQRPGAGFADAIALIQRACAKRGGALILRDWSHMDFIGLPYVPQPSYRFLLAESLQNRFEIVATSTVRHPIDQWLSLSAVPQMKTLRLESYLLGCRRFAEACQEHGFVRYEDFTEDPDACLKTICERLRLGFDQAYREKWSRNTHVTGDVKGSRGGVSEIRPVPRKDASPELLERFESSDDYRRTIELLGY